MSVTLGTIVLPDDTSWEDEFNGWSGVDAVTRHTLGGRLVVEQFPKAAGRPITLSSIWVDRATLGQIEQARDELGYLSVLTVADGRAFSVKFRHEEASVIEVVPVIGRPDYTDTAVLSYFDVKIKLIQF